MLSERLFADNAFHGARNNPVCGTSFFSYTNVVLGQISQFQSSSIEPDGTRPIYIQYMNPANSVLYSPPHGLLPVHWSRTVNHNAETTASNEGWV